MTGQTIEFFIVCDGLLWLRAFVQLIFFIVAINKNQCFIIIKVPLYDDIFCVTWTLCHT